MSLKQYLFRGISRSNTASIFRKNFGWGVLRPNVRQNYAIIIICILMQWKRNRLHCIHIYIVNKYRPLTIAIVVQTYCSFCFQNNWSNSTSFLQLLVLTAIGFQTARLRIEPGSSFIVVATRTQGKAQSQKQPFPHCG